MTPLDTIYITQKFGNNPDYYAQFGFKGHEGLDFRTKFDDSPDGKRKCRTICDGVAILKDEGAYGKHIIVQDYFGNQFYYCHLDSFLIKERQIVKKGEWIGVTGETGNTKGAHLHLCVKPPKPNLSNGYKGFVDPIDYIKKLLDVRVVNGGFAPLAEFANEVDRLSQGLIGISFEISEILISVPTVGMLNQDYAYEIVRFNQLKDKFIMIFYTGNATSSFLATFYFPENNNCISTIPLPTVGRLLAFEFAHQVQKFYNENRGELKSVEVVDNMYPTDELITSKFLSIAPYLDVFDGTYPNLDIMYTLIRHPDKFNEVYILKDRAIRHIVNLETLKQGDKEPNRLWVWEGSNIPQATAGDWATYTEGAEILLLPKD